MRGFQFAFDSRVRFLPATHYMPLRQMLLFSRLDAFMRRAMPMEKDLLIAAGSYDELKSPNKK
jgi:hypothetical protein